jgi:hypothetical protein
MQAPDNLNLYRAGWQGGPTDGGNLFQDNLPLTSKDKQQRIIPRQEPLFSKLQSATATAATMLAEDQHGSCFLSYLREGDLIEVDVARFDEESHWHTHKLVTDARIAVPPKRRDYDVRTVVLGFAGFCSSFRTIGMEVVAGVKVLPCMCSNL